VGPAWPSGALARRRPPSRAGAQQRGQVPGGHRPVRLPITAVGASSGLAGPSSSAAASNRLLAGQAGSARGHGTEGGAIVARAIQSGPSPPTGRSAPSHWRQGAQADQAAAPCCPRSGGNRRHTSAFPPPSRPAPRRTDRRKVRPSLKTQQGSEPPTPSPQACGGGSTPSAGAGQTPAAGWPAAAQQDRIRGRSRSWPWERPSLAGHDRSTPAEADRIEARAAGHSAAEGIRDRPARAFPHRSGNRPAVSGRECS